jgi:hypothetical protein
MKVLAYLRSTIGAAGSSAFHRLSEATAFISPVGKCFEAESDRSKLKSHPYAESRNQ